MGKLSIKIAIIIFRNRFTELVKRKNPGGLKLMNIINDDLWKAFKQLAEKYPDDQGIRMAADLARWVEEHYKRLASDAVVSPNEPQGGSTST